MRSCPPAGRAAVARWTGLRVRAWLSLCPYPAKSGRPVRAGGSRYSEFVQISHTLLCAEIGGNQNDEIGAGRGRGTGWHWPAGPGRQPSDIDWPLLDDSWWGSGPIQIAESWNVKMVDGRPSGPRDSVFAASLVDCVWKQLCLPVTGECWGHEEAATGPSLGSLRGLLNIKRGTARVS